jgi:hypothetical protein
MSYPLGVQSDLRLEFGGHTFTLRDEVGPPKGQVLRFDIPGLMAGVALGRLVATNSFARQAIVDMPHYLEQLHLQLWVSLEGKVLARLGHEAPPGAVAKLLSILSGF